MFSGQAMADGTAQQCGRVGSCHIYLQRASQYLLIGSFDLMKIVHHLIFCAYRLKRINKLTALRQDSRNRSKLLMEKS